MIPRIMARGTDTDAGDRRLLLVDPTDGLGRRFGDELAAAGFEVVRVGSAAECLRRVEREDVDGVVSAYALPDLDGVRLLRSLRVSYPTLPFVLVPEDGSGAIAGEAIAAGASGYVPAESDPATLVSRLRNSLQWEKPWVDAESGQRYRHLVEVSPAPINLFDETGESIWCNDAVLDLLGLDGRDELVGRSIFEFIHPEDHGLARGELQDVIGAKESVGPTRMRLRRSDGEVRHVRVSTAVGSFLGGDIGQAVVVDVTELRETQEELRAAREFIEETLDTLQDLFYVVDADGHLVEWNAVTTEVTGYDDAELGSMDLDDLFVEGARDRVRDSVARTLETGRDTVEAKLVTKHGRTLLYELRSRRLRTGGGTEEGGSAATFPSRRSGSDS
jgi:PAS domain S-box-containing protein